MKNAMHTGCSSPVWWANSKVFTQSIARLLPISSPAIVVLSLPRSGSSWVGRTLGQSDSSLYLWEPLNQVYLDETENPIGSFFEFEKVPSAYCRAADLAFQGLPCFKKLVVQLPKQWTLWNRTQKRVVIKEVNPFAARWLMETYQPKIIYLLRHPAAIAVSFIKMNFSFSHSDGIGKQFEKRLLSQTLRHLKDYKSFCTSYWAEFGAFQAVTNQLILEHLQTYKHLKVVQYEAICENPIEVFRDLYEFSELPWTTKIENSIAAQTTGNKPDQRGHINLSKDSKSMIHQWRNQIPAMALAAMKSAYLAYQPSFYNTESWW